jgi:hypothetical protein
LSSVIIRKKTRFTSLIGDDGSPSLDQRNAQQQTATTTAATTTTK